MVRREQTGETLPTATRGVIQLLLPQLIVSPAPSPLQMSNKFRELSFKFGCVPGTSTTGVLQAKAPWRLSNKRLLSEAPPAKLVDVAQELGHQGIGGGIFEIMPP